MTRLFNNIVAGISFGVCAGITFPFGVAITQVVFAGGQTVFN
jgi:hypothetical protein